MFGIPNPFAAIGELKELVIEHEQQKIDKIVDHNSNASTIAHSMIEDLKKCKHYEGDKMLHIICDNYPLMIDELRKAGGNARLYPVNCLPSMYDVKSIDGAKLTLKKVRRD